jgi:hypothetical protein
MNALPPGFEALEPFLDRWGGETSAARMEARSTASMVEIRAFYEVAIEHAEAALVYLERFPMNSLPEDAARLFRLMLGLVQASMAVEIHGQPRVPGAPWPSGVAIVQGLSPFG